MAEASFHRFAPYCTKAVNLPRDFHALFSESLIQNYLFIWDRVFLDTELGAGKLPMR
jgi:hypothetical protein